MPQNLFPRYLRLILAQKDGEEIDLGRLSCKFEVVRDSLGGHVRAKVLIFNLSNETIAKIQAKYVRMRLEAGHAQRSGTIFDGDINFTFTTRDGADRVTEIFAVSGSEALRNAKVNIEFHDGNSLRALVQQVAETFATIGDGPTIESMEVPDVPIVGDGVVSGQTSVVMNQLAKEYEFRWVIDNHRVKVFGRGSERGGTAIPVSRNTGLIASPIASQGGNIEFTTLLDPRLKPWARVEIVTLGATVGIDDSALQFVPGGIPVSGMMGGRFDIVRIVHVGHSRGQAWYTSAFAFPEGRL